MKYRIILIIIFAVSFWNCYKNYEIETEIARIQSSDVVYLGDEYIEVYLKNTELVNKGVCYSEKNSLPTLDDHVIFITHWSYDESYMVKLENLKEGVTYNCRVFIQEENAVAYGDVKSFTMRKTPSGWIQKTNFPGGERRYTTGFSIGNKGYMGLGVSNTTDMRDFWEYHPALNSWTQKASFPGNVKFNAIGFSIGNKGYVAVGYARELWEYDPATNSWTQKANLPGIERNYAVGFSIGNKGYMGMGYRGYYSQVLEDFWEYDPAIDKWTQKADFAGGKRYHAIGFSIGNKGYAGSGYEMNYGSLKEDFWEYDPVIDKWTQKADFVGVTSTAIVIPIGFSIEDKGYAGLADTKFFSEYDPVSNSWTQKANFFGEPRYDATGFVIGNKGYIGTGRYSTNQDFNDFWEFKP